MSRQLPLVRLSQPADESTPHCATDGRVFADLLERHPPERRQRQPRGVMLYSCCCCCCCCLHSFGAALGAALGGNYRGGGVSPFAESEPHKAQHQSPRRLPSTQGLYWTSFLIAILLSLAAAIVWSAMATPGYTEPRIAEGLIALGFIFILTAPAWFVAALPIMALRIAIRSELRSDPRYWGGLGRIAAGTVLGTIGGIAIMFALLLPFLGR